MTIHLSEDRQQFIRSLVQGGRYASESEVIDEALQLLEQCDQQTTTERRRIASLLQEGLASGPPTPMIVGDWDEIEREGNPIIAARRASEGR